MRPAGGKEALGVEIKRMREGMMGGAERRRVERRAGEEVTGDDSSV